MSAAAGWFPAPDRAGQERYWDGAVWTTAYRTSDGSTPAPASVAPAIKRRPKWLPWAVAAGLSLTLYGGRFIGQQQGWIAAGSIDGVGVQESIKNYALGTLNTNVEVSCPAEIPIKKDKVIDCTATGPGDKTSPVFVTVTDLDGHFTFQFGNPAIFFP